MFLLPEFSDKPEGLRFSVLLVDRAALSIFCGFGIVAGAV
jgi:hypothetical protein